MTTLLIILTALSLALAAGLAILTTRLLREDRARADARVAALTLLSAEPAVDVPAVEPPADGGSGNQFAAPALFAAHAPEPAWGRRLAVAGILAAIVAAGLLVSSGPHGSVPAPAAVSEQPAAAPLELVALRHTRDGQGLTVSGVVQNPRTGALLSGVVATVYVFGPGGEFLTSGRVPIAAAALPAGGDSPFAVTLPVNGEVARYRIGFRTATGAVIAHVDKRVADTLARAQEQR